MLGAEQRELLSAFMDGELSRADQALAGMLLRRDDGRRYLEGLISLRALLRRNADPVVPAGFAAGVIKALNAGLWRPRGDHTIRQLPPRGLVNPWIAAAAALMVAAGLFSGALFMPAQNSSLEKSGVARTEAKTRAIERPQPDSSATDRRVAPPMLAAANGGPAPSGPAVMPPQDAAEKQTVMRLGGEAIEVSLEVNRRNVAPSLQILNDVLRVGSLYGGATLRNDVTDEEFHGTDDREGSQFASSTFNNDCVEVELDEAKVAQFLDSLGRLSLSQRYGKLALPGYFKADVRKVAAVRADVENIVRAQNKDHGDGSLINKAALVLPLAARTRTALKDAGPPEAAKVAADVRMLECDYQDDKTGCMDDVKETTRRKVVVVIRLR